MPAFPHWFEADPAILEHEQREYERHGLNFVLDQELLTTRQVVAFKGTVKVTGREFSLEVVYPPGYPFIRPEVYSRDTSLHRHQNPINKNLCVLPNEEDDWDWSTMSGAFMVRQAERLLEDSFTGSASVAANEVPAPEPQITWLGHLFSGALLIAEQFQQIPNESSGNFTIQALSFESSEPIRALLSSATIHAAQKTTTVTAPSALQKVYEKGISLAGAWFKTDSIPDSESVSDFALLRRWVLGQKSLENLQKKNKKQRAGDFHNIDLVGIVVTDEGRKRGEFHDTWVVLLSWQDSRGRVFERVIRPALLSESDRFSRAPQLISLSSKSAMIFGVGALGSTIAIQLARAGIGGLHLLDYDVIEPANLVRHEADVFDIGANKAEVLAARIAKVNPFTSVNLGNARIGRLNPKGIDVYANADHLQKLADYVSETDLVVAVPGGGGLNHVLNRMCLHTLRPSVFAWVSNGAWGGRVLRMIPGVTGCYECAARNPSAVEPNSDPDSPPVYARGCAYPSFTGSGFDIATISMLATRLAVQTVLRDERDAYPDASFDHIVWQNRGASSGPFPQLAQFEISKQKGCTACGS